MDRQDDDEAPPVATGPDGAEAEGPRRAAVRRLLLERLDEAGMVRPRGMTVEAAAAMRRRLVEALDYLADASLVALAEQVLRLGAGPLRHVWPAEATVLNLAAALQEPPSERWSIINSWLASVEGPVARERGYLTELYLWLCRLPHPRPPGRATDMPAILERAADNRRLRALYQRRLAEGSASDEERRWLAGYARAEARAHQIVAAGEARRAQKGAA